MFLLFWGGVFVLLGVFFVFRALARNKILVFFRRRHEQNREFPLCKGVERRTRTGGTADQNGWNDGGPERVERRTRTGETADHEGGTADRQV